MKCTLSNNTVSVINSHNYFFLLSHALRTGSYVHLGKHLVRWNSMAEVRPCTEISGSSLHLLGDYSSRLDTVRSFLEHASLVCAVSLIVASTTLQTLIKYWYRDFPIDEIQAFRDLDAMVLARGFNEILARCPIIDSQPISFCELSYR